MGRGLKLRAGLLVVLAVAAGCGEAAASDAAAVRVVASTNVYGDIVERIAANATATVSVTSIIADPSQDPHSYEADTQNQLALSKADLVVENGGGYDDFMDALRRSAGGSRATVLNAVKVSGRSGAVNEHVWYDFPTVEKLVARIATALSSADPADKATFSANAAAFTQQLKTLEATEAAIKSASGGEGVAITEPVPLYLLAACGLVDKTPAEFSEAVEEGTDVPPAVLRSTLALFSGHSVRALVYNAQTSGPETTAVLAAARSAGIPAVPVTETLPAGKDYLGWMSGNLAAVRAAVR